MLLCRVTKFSSSNFQRLLLRETILLLVRIVIFVSQAVSDLLRLDLFEEHACKPNIINPLSLSTRSSGKQRLILDLRHVNQFIYKQKFKCEDLGVATQLFDCNYYLFKFELTSGYHQIEIFPDHRKFLAFTWDFGNGVSRYFQLCVLPFRLSSAPYIFTSILKPWSNFRIPRNSFTCH